MASPATTPSPGVLRMRSSRDAARRLRGDGERAVFDEAAGIDQRGDVLARRALAGLAPPRDGVRAILVEAERLPREHLGEVGPDGVQIAAA